MPGLYTKLMDVDKVDIIASSYATNMIAPAMPIVMQHDRTFFALLGLAVNSEFNYKHYFSMTPTGGPRPKELFAEGFFEVAAGQTPKPMTVAMCGADAEYPRQRLDGARNVIKRLGLQDRLRQDLSAGHVRLHAGGARDRGDQSRHLPRLLLSGRHGRPASAPATRSGFKPKITAAAWSACRRPPIKTQLGPLLNGIVVYDFWLPWAGLRLRRGPRVRQEVPDQVGRAPASTCWATTCRPSPMRACS